MREAGRVGRRTHIVECRSSSGGARGGDLAFPGTTSEAARPDIIVVAMSSSSRHITRPVCQITYALREAGFEVSVIVLASGSGTPGDSAPTNTLGTSIMWVTPTEKAQIARHRMALIHVGNVPSHFIPKIRELLRDVDVPAVVISQARIDMDDLVEEGIRAGNQEPSEAETVGRVVDLVNGVVRGQRCSSAKIGEIISKTGRAIREAPA
jgi:methyl-coenzyme M reductase subunit C